MQWNKNPIAAHPPWDDLWQEPQIHLSESSLGSQGPLKDPALVDEVSRSNQECRKILVIAVDQALYLLSRITSRNRRE